MMKRVLISAFLIVSMLLPALAQEKRKEQKLQELEQLEQQVKQATIPDTPVSAAGDTLVAEAEDLLVAAAEHTPVTTAEDTLVAAAEDTLAVIMAEDEEIAVVVSDDADDTSTVRIGEIVTIKNTDDETIIRIGRKGVRVYDEGDSTEIDFVDKEYGKKERGRTGRHFYGHLGGIEIGYNNFSTATWLKNDAPIAGYLDLNTSKSINFNIVSPPASMGFTRHFGLVAALGISFNNYRFEGNNSITVDEGGIISPLFPADPVRYDKSKLATIYGILPVVLEVQIPVSRGSSINLGAGVIGAVKLGSYTKVVHYNNGKQKEKNHEDFNLNMLRYGVTVRAGYEMVQVYGTCYLSPMFEKGKGPELYPFEVGIAVTIND
ncbi:MAG: outer membrane beta-barrel protein [Bacteroidales bacterium]|nr:outer membrane beta-barrel protein [Bacteroidales bacterium]MBK7732762.1 outer membrane beta-barrel protein [Bacteroidales bacterium]